MSQHPKVQRLPLKRLMGEVVEVEGHVEQVKSTEGFLDLLICNAKVAHLVKNRTLTQCDQWKIDHIWIKQELTETDLVARYEVERYQSFNGQGTPYQYKRQDGSIAYAVRMWSHVGIEDAEFLMSNRPIDGDWAARADFIQDIVTRACNNQLRLNTLNDTHNEVLFWCKRWLRDARRNRDAVAKAPKADKPKVPTFAQLLREK